MGPVNGEDPAFGSPIPFPQSLALAGPSAADPLAWGIGAASFSSVAPALSPGPGGGELYVVTTSDGALAALADQLSHAGAEVLRLAPGAGIDALLQTLAQGSASGPIQRLHLINHATEGVLRIGDTLITTHTLDRQREALGALGRFLSPTADLLLYGCDLAAGADGRELVAGLARLTGSDVAASSNRTFADGPGAPHDWTLEVSVGPIAPGGQDRLTGLGWSGALGGSASLRTVCCASATPPVPSPSPVR